MFRLCSENPLESGDTMRHLLHILTFMFAFVLSASFAFAQVPTGTPPYGSFTGGPDVIDLANLNVHLDVPVFNKAGRGMNFTYDLSYETSVWTPQNSSGNHVWTPVYNWGWRGQTEVATGYISYNLSVYECWYQLPHQPEWEGYELDTYDTFVYHDPWGVSHPFNGDTYVYIPYTPGGSCKVGTNHSLTALATDGSGQTLNANASAWTFTITTPTGKVVTPPLGFGSGSGTTTDRNGNQISVTSGGVFTDTLGTTALTVAGTAPSNTTFTYTAPGPGGSGVPAAYTMKYVTKMVQTKFGCSGISEFGPTSTSLVSEIDLPDGSNYLFTYEQTPSVPANVTGRLASITLPTGGTITYVYTGGSSGNITCADGSTSGLTRTVSPGGQWSYVRTAGSGAAYTTTVTDPERDTLAPNGNDTVIQFQGIYETQRQVYQGSHTSGTLLATTNTCYNASASPCNSTAITLPIAQRTVIATLPGPNNLQSKHSDFFNAVGMPTETDDYDYGPGAPPSTPLRQVLYTYASLGNISAFKQTITVKDGAGRTLSQITYNYDEGTVTASSGTPQHTSVSGSRGNLTSIHYPVGSLTKSFTYYDTGTTKTATDVNGQITTFNYPDAVTTCGNAFPTGVSITQPISMSTSTVWNCTGAVATSVTDANGKITTSSYTDANFWRPASVTDPASAVTSFTYPASSPYNNVESTLLFNSGNSVIDALKTIDGLGRPRVAQIKQGPGATNYDSTETDFDVIGGLSRATMPYSGTAGQTNSSSPATNTTYDALGRPLSIVDGGNGTTTYTYSQNDVLVVVSPAPTGESSKQRQLE